MTLIRRRKRALWILVTLIFMGAIISNYWQHENASSVESGLQRTLSDKMKLASDSRTNGNDEEDDAKSKAHKDSIDNILSAISKRRFPKVYIYTLPEKYNLDIQKCVPINYACLRLKNRGFGESLYKDDELSVFRTHQFSLEVIIHNLLLLSKYRTKDPTEADIFYIPAYMGLQFFCKSDVKVKVLQEDMFSFVNSMPYLKQGRPHLSTLAKIEREMTHSSFPVLQNPLCRNITYIVIEKESNEKYRKSLGLEKQRVIVAPYPSYGHLDSMLAVSQTLASPSLESRRVFMFLAASDRRTNPFRNSIVDQFTHSVMDTGVSDYIAIRNISSPGLHQVWLNTRECKASHENITIEWMQNAVFCLQPHGDSPTRKSFYDSIVSGCIPVIFKFYGENVSYPFQRVIKYSEFVVTIDASRVQNNGEFVLNILKDISKSETERLHNNVLRVARQLQYSFIDENTYELYHDTPYVDAIDMIMDEAKYMYNL